MAASGLANWESAPALKPASHPSKARHSFRRRRSRSWHFEGWESRPAPPRIRPSFGATTPPASGHDAGDRRLQLETGGESLEGEQTAPVAVGVSPSSKKWLSFFGKRKKLSISGKGSAAASAAARGRDEGAAHPYAAREGAKAGDPRNRKAGAVAAPEAETTSGAESAAVVEERQSKLTERSQIEEQPKLRELTDAGGRVVATAAAAVEPAGQKSLAPAPQPTLPTYEEARRRTHHQQQRQQQARDGQGLQGQLQAGDTTNAAGYASPPAAASIRSGDAKSTQQGRRRDSSGVSLRRGGVKSTTGLEPGARVLCLDIFVSATGGGEIRQWRPAEVSTAAVVCQRGKRRTRWALEHGSRTLLGRSLVIILCWSVKCVVCLTPISQHGTSSAAAVSGTSVSPAIMHA